MNRLTRLLSMILFVLIISFSSYGESIQILYNTSHEITGIKKNGLIYALLLDNDTIFSSSDDGIWAKYGKNKLWLKIIGCVPIDNNREGCYNKNKWDKLYSPDYIGRNPVTDEIIVFDDYCGILLSLQVDDSEEYFTKLWKRGKEGEDYFEDVTIYENLLLSGVYSTKNKLVVLEDLTKPDSYERIFDNPPLLKQKLDSLGIKSSICFPAYNPGNKKIWLNIWGYEFIYIIDINGHLLDSIQIISPDFIYPQPPRSRLQSKAIWDDWIKKWTPVRVFKYVPPGYFILQYITGWDVVEVDSIPLYGTLIWTTNRTPVILDLDKHWQLAGVQPDGRVIFAHYQVEDNQRKIALHVARIVP